VVRRQAKRNARRDEPGRNARETPGDDSRCLPANGGGCSREYVRSKGKTRNGDLAVKRRELVRSLTERGCYLKRHGANHDLYTNPVNGRTVPVPRHAEIKDTLARAIRKQLGLE